MLVTQSYDADRIQIHFSAESDIPELRKKARAALAKWGRDGEHIHDATTIITELASNAIRHAPPKNHDQKPFLLLTRVYELTWICVWDPSLVPPVIHRKMEAEFIPESGEKAMTDRELEDMEEGGRGLSMVRSLAGDSLGWVFVFPPLGGKYVYASLT